MHQDAINLFHELADRSPAEREDYYAQQQVPSAVRAEVESLLRFDGPGGQSLGAYLISAAEEVLRQGDDVAEVIAHYRITNILGEGGMGKVYRAIDTKLGREVAIKVIPKLFAQDASRMARFSLEARVLASMNHPNIAAIYGVEDRALVLELVEGPTLAERIAQGPVPLEEALEIARQLADALEAAHEKGFVHRDLKPANVKVNPQGIVKVLDFGLAMAQRSPIDTPTPDHGDNPSTPKTEAGAILGTAAYMSPEQARGKAVDRRADVWAFGVVLYEMLTAKRPFDGATVSDTLVAVLNTEPDWTRIPAKVQRLLRACLQKDPKHRLHAIGDAKLLIEDSVEVVAPRARPWQAWAGVAAICIILAAIGWLRFGTGRGVAPSLAFTILPVQHSDPLPGDIREPPLISPDGTYVHWTGPDGLELRRLDSIHAEIVKGTEATNNLSFWSSDSKAIAFPTASALLKVRVPDGTPEIITKLRIPSRGGAWSERGTILFSVSHGLMSVSAAGGEASRIEVPGLNEGRFYYPEFLPGGEDFLVLFVPDGAGEAGVYLVSLHIGKPADPVLLMRNTTAAHYSPVAGGRIFFVRNDNLYEQKLDTKVRKVEGDPELVERGVASDPSHHLALFSVSRSGVLAWRPGRAAFSQATIFDRTGRQIGLSGPPGVFNSIRLSPDETHILTDSEDSSHLLEAGRPGILLLSDWNWRFWSPDGRRLIGQGGGSGALVESGSGGSDETHELRQKLVGRLEDISPDGKLFLCRKEDGSLSSVVFDDSAVEHQPKSVVQTNEFIYTSRFSPDGRWITYYAHNGIASLGIYVQPFPGPGLRRQIADHGRYPVWRKDGKEILYADPKGIWSVPISAVAGELRFGAPQFLFSVRFPASMILGFNPLDVSKDGSRIYFVQGVEQPDADVIHVKMGWTRSGAK